MPAKLRKLSGKPGFYYPRKDGGTKYRGKRYSRYGIKRDAGIKDRHPPQGKRKYQHTGDKSRRRKTTVGRTKGWH